MTKANQPPMTGGVRGLMASARAKARAAEPPEAKAGDGGVRCKPRRPAPFSALAPLGALASLPHLLPLARLALPTLLMLSSTAFAQLYDTTEITRGNHCAGAFNWRVLPAAMNRDGNVVGTAIPTTGAASPFPFRYGYYPPTGDRRLHSLAGSSPGTLVALGGTGISPWPGFERIVGHGLTTTCPPGFCGDVRDAGFSFLNPKPLETFATASNTQLPLPQIGSQTAATANFHPTAVNAYGDIVGYSTDGSIIHAVLYTGGSFKDLGAGWYAHAINDAGRVLLSKVIAGTTAESGPVSVYSPDGTLQALPDAFRLSTDTDANFQIPRSGALSANGAVAGYVNAVVNGQTVPHAAVWTGTQLLELDPAVPACADPVFTLKVGGRPVNQGSMAAGVNAKGEVLINAYGQVDGAAGCMVQPHLYTSSDGTMKNLTRAVAAGDLILRPPNPSLAVLNSGFMINDRGQILVRGPLNSDPCGQWSPLWLLTRQPGDTVNTVRGASSAGYLVSGLDASLGNVQWVKQPVGPGNGAQDVGTNLVAGPAGAGANEVIAFAAGFAPTIVDEAPWTGGINHINVPMRPVQPMPIRQVLLAGGPAAPMKALADLVFADFIFTREKAGFHVTLGTEMRDLRYKYAAPLRQLTADNHTDCKRELGALADRIRTNDLMQADGIVVFYVDQLALLDGTKVTALQGYTCSDPLRQRVDIFVAKEADAMTLAHELGHAYGLGHFATADDANLMNPAGAEGSFLTEGQTFNMHFHVKSAAVFVNHAIRPEAARVCPTTYDAGNPLLSLPSRFCPALNTRLWPESANGN